MKPEKAYDYSSHANLHELGKNMPAEKEIKLKTAG